MSSRPRKGVVRSILAHGTLVAVLGMTLGCSESSPTRPTPTPVTPTPVAPAPVAPAPVAPSGVYTVTASTDLVAPGGELSVSWTASTGRSLDWISLFRAGDGNTAYGWYEYMEGATSGTFTLSAPTEAGQYEFRYLLNDGYTDVARSGPVTVGTGP